MTTPPPEPSAADAPPAPPPPDLSSPDSGAGQGGWIVPALMSAAIPFAGMLLVRTAPADRLRVIVGVASVVGAVAVLHVLARWLGMGPGGETVLGLVLRWAKDALWLGGAVAGFVYTRDAWSAEHQGGAPWLFVVTGS